MCATVCVHNTTCCTHTFSRSFVSSSLRTLRVQNACAYWLKFKSYVSCAKHSHPLMCHPPSSLYPHGHFNVHFPASPAPSPAMPCPRSVKTPSPRRATPPGGPVSGSMATTHKWNVHYSIDESNIKANIDFPEQPKMLNLQHKCP